jgi:hypothetical protein
LFAGGEVFCLLVLFVLLVVSGRLLELFELAGAVRV